MDRLELAHPVGSGKKIGDIMSWSKQVPTFIFGIIPWNCGKMSFFHVEPRTGNKEVKETHTVRVLKLY